jgi:hypothetical protein
MALKNTGEHMANAPFTVGSRHVNAGESLFGMLEQFHKAMRIGQVNFVVGPANSRGHGQVGKKPIQCFGIRHKCAREIIAL